MDGDRPDRPPRPRRQLPAAGAGTGIDDHLVSGLVPLAVLLGLAWLYPRVRAGARASIALSLGILGIVIGASEALYYALKVGASGDDYTGFLALGAGVVLVGLGAVTLWTSRHTDDGLVRRYGRRLLLAVAAFVVLAVLIAPIAIAYGFTHASRAVVPPAKLGAAYENVSFKTSDGLTLKGWYVPSKNGAAVVVFPGRTGPQRQVRMLVRHGYGALLFDRRGEAASDGDPNIFGWEFDKDLRGAAAYLRRRPDVEPHRIGGIGLSVGGEALLQTAARSNAYDAVVSEGAGVRSVREMAMLDGVWHLVPSMTASHGRDRGLRERDAAAEPRRPQPAHQEAGVLHLRRSRPGRREPQREVLRRGERAEDALEDLGRRAHRGNRGQAGRVRTPRGRVLRPELARALRRAAALTPAPPLLQGEGDLGAGLPVPRSVLAPAVWRLIQLGQVFK